MFPELRIGQFTCVSNKYWSENWNPHKRATTLMTSYELILKIAGFIHFEMENEPFKADLVEVKAMDVENASKESSVVKKHVSIVDTRLAINPKVLQHTCSTTEMFGVFFKHVVMNKTLDPPQIDHLAFITYNDITLKCKQERSVSKF